MGRLSGRARTELSIRGSRREGRVAEVRLLLEHELDLAREQATLVEVARLYRSSIGIRVPTLVPPLCTSNITAMTVENGVKVTEAFPYSPQRRSQIAAQVIEALLAVPLFSREPHAVFRADPHAGNLLYDEPSRELIVLDWALSDRLSLALQRHVVMLAIMMLLRKPAGVCHLRTSAATWRTRSMPWSRICLGSAAAR